METLLDPVEDTPINHSDEAMVCTKGVTRILLGGMDNAGKSTLACSLYLAMKHQGVDVSLHEVDPWSDTHEPILGKKPWSSRQKRHDVTPELYQKFVDRFASDNADIVLGDMQGRSQYANNHMLSGKADFGVLVSRDPIPADFNTSVRQHESDWEDLFNDLEIPVAVRVRSVLPGRRAPRGYYVVEGLERKPLPNKPQIQNLGKMLIGLTQQIKG